MIEICARIIQRSVFITEEEITCEVKITNHGHNKNVNDEVKRRHSRHASDTRVIAPEAWNRGVNMEVKSKDESVMLALASAQIYCHCDVNERRLRLPVSIHNHSKQDHVKQHTSFSPVMGEKGHCLYTTEASVLFCDLKLRKGETKKFIYSDVLPSEVPPSYKGQHIKFSYKICIGVGRVGQPLCIIRLPFRLFELKGIFKSIKRNSSVQQDSDGPTLSPKKEQSDTNPFLEEDLLESYSLLDAAMDTLTTLTVKRNLNTYNIASTSGCVGKFCLSKHYYRLGEDVLGTFDLTGSEVSCIKFTVSLQVEETISKSCLLQPSSSNFVHYITLCRHEECCYHTTKTNFLLPIPVTATPEFTHKIVSVRWRLHFEFTIEMKDNTMEKSTLKTNVEENQMNLSIPSTLKTELMLWDLPIHVVATNPILASLMMQADSSETVLLSDS